MSASLKQHLLLPLTFLCHYLQHPGQEMSLRQPGTKASSSKIGSWAVSGLWSRCDEGPRGLFGDSDLCTAQGEDQALL